MVAPELVRNAGTPHPLGASIVADGVNFAVRSGTASEMFVCLFDEADSEIAMLPLDNKGGVFCGLVAGIGAGARYGLRADGDYAPDKGFWFDPAKLLVDPYARRLDRAFVSDPRLAMPRDGAVDTAPIVPKAFVEPLRPAARRSASGPPSLIYELNVRGFTRAHPGVPEKLRGTVTGLGESAVIEHLVKLEVDTLELMPVAAWIDEQHLHARGLANFWGYNPVAFMAPEPRLMPGGVSDLAQLTQALAEAGISVILDVVLNHTGEGDALGPVLSLRGLDNLGYYRHRQAEAGLELVNDTGTGNTLACDRPAMIELALASLRHWVTQAGVTGFRFDLGTVLGRTDAGFDPDAPLLAAIRADPVLGQCLLIAEPWDVGPGGYQLGGFGPPFFEWNDRFRDDARRFWRGDAGAAGAFATRLTGSSDLFAGPAASRSVNFVAAHDGFTLADLVAYEGKHNLANLEDNRDGHDDNFSWNNGVEGDTSDAEIATRRRHDVRAMLTSLFLARGVPMLAAGDEIGKTQAGNNNAYAQDNEISWIDWSRADPGLIDFVAALSRLRAAHPALVSRLPLTGEAGADGRIDCRWIDPQGHDLDAAGWHTADAFGMLLDQDGDTILTWFNRARGEMRATCPTLPGGVSWRLTLATRPNAAGPANGALKLPARSVMVLVPGAGAGL